MVKEMNINTPRFKAIISADKAIINDKKININKDDINNLLRIIRDWKREYKNNFSVNIYSIRIIFEKEEVLYNFYDAFPDDYYLLEEYLGGIYVSG